MANVELRAVRKAYGSASVIHGVSVDIDQSEFVILVGPSGCGKSTLLRMIAGLENITGGEIRIGGRLVNNVAPKERDIAMVFQNYALYPHMTVSENMAFSLKLKKAPERNGRHASSVRQRSSVSQIFSTATRGSYQAVSDSGLPWVAQSCGTRRYFFSTSHCRTSMPSCACRCGRRSRSCISV